MPSLSLKIILDEGAVTRKVKFDTRMTVRDAHKVVKEKVIVPDKAKEYALFLRSADNETSGVWLEDDRTLDYYMLRDGDSLDYICRNRNLRVRLLDDTVKTLQVDEAKTVGELMVNVCARIGITNHDEYGLCHEEVEETDDGKESKDPGTGTGTLTLKRKQQPKDRDVVLEQMSKKLKTDDNVEWLDQHRTLREQGIDVKETLLLKRRLFFSDRNVDSRDPVQLNLLYVQIRDAILNGRHPVTEQLAADFAGIQCQIHFGDYQEKKHKPGFLENLQEYLPEQYSNSWGVERKILKAYSQHQGLSPLDAKYLYIKTARALPTYGVTFFLVKEKQKDKKKLVPRLLGINAEAILRLDEVTKEILQQWPLTHVKMYHAGKSQTFTLNFGDYSEKEYSVKTQDCHRIRDILEGYIDIIRRRMLAKPTSDPGDAMAICHDNVQPGKSHLIEHVSNNPSKMITETFVGPKRILPHEHASQAQSGATITTVQQIVVSDHLQNQQQAFKGEIPLRGDMSKDCIRRLNRLNSNSVKIVGLLTDPTDDQVKDAQKIIENMQEDLPVVEKGVRETAEMQTVDGAKKQLLDELQDLVNHMNELVGSTKPGHVNPSNAKAAAESIADLTTQMYFSIDPKTRRRSDLLRRSRKSFKAGEKTEDTIRRASFIAAATTAMHSVDTAAQALNENYTGPKLDDAQRKRLEMSLQDRMGKLNAAIALYLTAHSDPENIDYSAAINSMNAINELMPKLTRDAQILGSTKDPAARKELQNEMRALFDATKKVCGLISNDEHEKMQEATNNYADIAQKLIFTFARGTNANMENEIIELAKDAGAKTSLLLVATNELPCHPSVALEQARVRTAGAARDLLACAQLTAPAVHEPHCQSALTASAERLSSCIHNMESSWRPLLEDPTTQYMTEPLRGKAMDVMKALQRLKDAYGGLGTDNADDASLPLQERQRLKFIATMSGAKNNLQGVEDLWSKSATGTPSEQERVQAQRRLEQQMAQLNAAVAALAAATADRENPDYTTAELAVSAISELLPQIVRDTEVVSSDKDEGTRNAMMKHIQALCEATRQMCEGAGYQHGQGEAASKFAAASGKLVFLVSPGADKGKQKYIMEQSSIACDQASELLGQAQRLRQHVGGAPDQLYVQGARAADAAQALLSVAQVTASTISEGRCQDALAAAVERLRACAARVTSSCRPHDQHDQHDQHEHAAMLNTQQLMDDSLRKLADICQGLDVNSGDTVVSAQQEKQRLQFINTMSGAKERLDAVEQQLNKPHACQMMREEDAAVLEHKLSQRLAQLNAAIAALTAATADREHPDYAAADRAVHTITELMPQLIQESRTLCGTKNDAGQAAMLEELRALCEATRQLCDCVGEPQGVGDAAAKFSAASGKLVFLVSPRADTEMENQVLDLSTAACRKTSELLSQVQTLTQQVEPPAAAELDSRGARAADAAQALLNVAQVTAPSIMEPSCQNELVSAAERLRQTAGQLSASCGPHLQQRPQLQQRVLDTQEQLHDTLDTLVNACKSAKPSTPRHVSGEPEKQRLKFVGITSAAKNRLDEAEHQLKQPMVSQAIKPEDAAVVQHKLSQRLAQLNAAVAALTAATADRENPDYVAAERAVKDISELMPLVVQDSRKLSSTKDDAGKAAMLQDVTALCEATRELCENADKGVGEAAAKFFAASGKLVFLVSPRHDDAQEKQIMALSADTCGKASELLSQVQTLTQQVEPPAAAELDSRGARAADAAQALLTIAQATAPTISEPSCSAALVSSAEKLRSSASELTASCGPHLQQRPQLQQRVLDTGNQLSNSLDTLVNACKSAKPSTRLDVSGEREKQRLKFVSSSSAAKNRLDEAEQQLKQPMVSQVIKPEDAAVVQHKLSQRLAQLNAAVAALTAATADRENPDYVAAERAVKDISELMPLVVQDSRKLSSTKDDAGKAAMLQDVTALCEATRELCENADKGVGEAAAKFFAASGKLVFLVSPRHDDAQEKQIMALSAATCGKTSELLSQVQTLTQQVEPPAAAELDSRGARAADAAQALLNVAQATAPTISEPSCSAALVSSAEKLRSSASELTASCGPHLQQRPQLQQRVLDTGNQLSNSLDTLVDACRSAKPSTRLDVSGEREKQRLKFVSSSSAAKNRLDEAEQQLKQPMVSQAIKPEDAAVVQHKLSQRLAQLNAAVAALTAATADRENPDYVAAERAVKDISELMPLVVQDSRKLSSTKDDAGKSAMLQDVTALCEATRELCENADNGVGEAAAKFFAASGKLVFLVSPRHDDAQEKQIMALSADTCGKASELLSQVQTLSQQVEPPAAAELDSRGARAADAAQALLNVAQATAPTISEPSCSAALVSSAEKLRSSASELTASCGPHLQQRPQLQQRVLDTGNQLSNSLDTLVNACRSAQQGSDITLSPQQEKQCLKFVSNVSGAKNRLDAVEQQMKEPILCQLMKPEDGAALQHKLSDRLVQLNAAIAALTDATSDNKNPDYRAAERAVNTISELMPLLVQDSRTLCGTKDDAGQAAMLEHLRSLCEASRDLCDSKGHPTKLHEASSKLGRASNKLVFLVGPQQARQQLGDANVQAAKPAVTSKKPAVPVRNPKHTVAHAVPPPRSAAITQDFLHMLQCEESQDNSAGIVKANVNGSQAAPDKDKRAYNKFLQVVDNAEKELKTAEDGLIVPYDVASMSVGGPTCAEDTARREQHAEDALAAAASHVAAIVAANYADILDYKAALEPTIALTKSVKSVLDDGSVVSGSLYETARKPFLDDLTGLSGATRNICDAAKSNKEKLNDAAILFGDKSANLLRVVSSDVNPDLEKQVISRAKAIGDTASRLALEASTVVSSTSSTQDGDIHVQDICTAGARCVDAAGKLVYTAKLVAPTIHHSTCQDTLVSSADSLSTSLATFCNTWAPLASAQHPNVQKLTEEANNLEKLVEKLRGDIRTGKLGKRREVERLVNLETPLRQMTMQIIENADKMAEHGEISPELKKEYRNYSSRLAEAIRALDLASARYQRAPHNKNKRNEMDIAIQDLQMTLLQTRPSRAGQEVNNIVDFRDFLQDLVNEADILQETAKKNEGPAGKRVTDDIQLLCSKLSEDATKLLNPDQQTDGVMVMSSVDDIEDIDQFGQECDLLVKEIDALIRGIHDQKAKQTLRAKALPLTESCHLLRFATNSHISATKSAAFDEVLRDLDNFKTGVMKPLVHEVINKTKKEKKVYMPPVSARSSHASSSLLRAASAAVSGEPESLCQKLTYYSATTANQTSPDDADEVLAHLYSMVGSVQDVTGTACLKISNFEDRIRCVIEEHPHKTLKELHDLDHTIAARKIEVPVLDAEDIDKLLLCEKQKVEGTPNQLEEKVQQLSTKLSSMSGTVVLSVTSAGPLRRGLAAAAHVAAHLANTARALKDYRRPAQSKRIEDAAREMCLATYSLLKTSELVCQYPNHHDSRRKLVEACHHLNDSINKLVRSVSPAGKVAQECGEVQRNLQLQRSVLQAPPQPAGAMPYAHCLDTMYSQKDVLQKLNTEQAMSRSQFLQSMKYVAAAVGYSAECAAHAAYLLSVSEKDESIGKEGVVDVPKLHKAVTAVEDTCVSIIRAQNGEQIQEETKVLESGVRELLESLDDATKRTKDSDLKNMLKECRQSVNSSASALFNGVQNKKLDKQETISLVMNLMDDVNDAANLIEHPDLVPTVTEVSADTKAKVDEVVKSSLALLTNTEDLIKQVKSTPDDGEVMKWVMFNKRKDVLDAFEALVKSIKSAGQRSNLLEGAMEDSEEEKKSYVQKQFDTASKWLLKSISKAEVKTNGQQAVRNLIDVAKKITEDLKSNDKEDMRHLVMETEQLLTECTKKYDQEQYSVLMERVRELKKGIERGVVTRVVEDFMEAEAPLADLDIIADHEKDETKRKFLLEQKIAELLAQLSRVTRTARLIADTDRDSANNITTQLNSCSQQAELLAPMLVKAAQQRVAAPDDKAVIENYQALIAKYAESLSKIRDLCDQSVDPMDFVQTAGETMQRMREESSRHDDPLRCAHTSAAITKLANRVIHVGMSSSTARSDPELQQALTEAQHQLSAATPAADTRASRMPDWKDTTAKILQATEEVESLLGGETIFKTQPGPNQPIYNEALNLHVAIRDWSSRDNEIVAVAKRMAVLMAKLSNFMNNDKQREVLSTSKSIVSESHEVARLARKLAHECSDHRIRTNLLQTCERIPTISGQLKMLTTVKGFALGRHGTEEDKEAMDMVVGNAQSLMLSIQDVVKGAASASVKIMSQRGPRMRWVRKTVY